jgi:cellulose synthase/poly-beta-1,6-N-acetylglucosamine synthase-like glycosyltransferase
MTIFVPIPAFLLAGAPSLSSQFIDALYDNTFAGIHHLEFFDWAIMVPYFAVLAVLSVYGLHRYETIRGYMKHHKRMAAAPPPMRFTELPRVTIQLPIFNERFVVERLLEETAKMDYPRHLLKFRCWTIRPTILTRLPKNWSANIAMRDCPSSTSTVRIATDIRRRPRKRAETATGEVVAVFDADSPPSDFLQRTVHHFTDPKVGVVQTRWTYLNRGHNVLTEVQAILLDGHFVLEHVATAGGGLFFNFNGTAGILRKSMIQDAGGWQHDTLTEDSDLSYRAQLKGWKFVYDPSVECLSELPVETYGFQVQQSR